MKWSLVIGTIVLYGTGYAQAKGSDGELNLIKSNANTRIGIVQLQNKTRSQAMNAIALVEERLDHRHCGVDDPVHILRCNIVCR